MVVWPYAWRGEAEWQAQDGRACATRGMVRNPALQPQSVFLDPLASVKITALWGASSNV
jgi:hypothetical protein